MKKKWYKSWGFWLGALIGYALPIASWLGHSFVCQVNSTFVIQCIRNLSDMLFIFVPIILGGVIGHKLTKK